MSVETRGNIDPEATAVRAPPSVPEDGCVDIWIGDLREWRPAHAVLRAGLSADEITRADRFRFERDAIDFVVCRGILRLLLGRYLSCPAAAVRFAYSARGKPRLAGRCAPADLRFNLSHTDGLAAYAFIVGTEIGVDVERIRTLEDRDRVAERVFFGSERRAYRRACPDERDAVFFRGWTRKEAYVKAGGYGLGLPLDRFAVSLGEGARARVLHVDGSRDAARAWVLASFRPGRDYTGAVCHRSPAREYRYVRLRWPGAAARSGPDAVPAPPGER